MQRHKNNLQPYDAASDSSNLVGMNRHVSATRMQQHYPSVYRHNRAIHAASPSSYTGSMEIAPYNPAITSSIELKERTIEKSPGLKISTELLKVLNRIWSLEEQHSSNTTLVNVLKKELDKSRSQIKVLLREQQSDRREIDELVKRITENKFSDVQAVLVRVTKERDSERESRVLLEKLCDEFALGMRQKHGKSGEFDEFVLHFAESWIDARAQMKLHNRNTNITVVDRLRSEIEAFLEGKRNTTLRPRSSVTAVSAPIDESDSNCFEIEMPRLEQGRQDEEVKKKSGFGPSPSSLQIMFEARQPSEMGKAGEDENGRVDSMKLCDASLKNRIGNGKEHVGSSSSSSQWRNLPSPVREWNHKMESCSRLGPDYGESSLKAKLSEAKSKGQRSSRSRLKTHILSRRG